MSLAGPGKNLKGGIMKKEWIKTFKLWAETKEYKSSISLAQKVIKGAINKYNNPYLSFSGGKDSTVMLHLVLQEYGEIPVWHWDYGNQLMPRSIEKEVVMNARKIGVKKLIVEKRQGFDARVNPGQGYKQFFGSINRLKKEHGWSLGFVGVRQEESIKRKSNYKSFIIDDNCYPLLKMCWRDVWAYIVSNDLPYPSVYDKYSELLGYDKSRFVTFFDKEFEHIGACNIDGVLMPGFRNERPVDWDK